MSRLAVLLFFLFTVYFTGMVQAQYLPEHISNEGIYDFLDELANDHIIDLISVVKPYSRALISEKLNEASRAGHQMTMRQRQMLEMYQAEFAMHTPRRAAIRAGTGRGSSGFNMHLLPPSLDYQDGSVNVSLRPILGGHYHTNENGDISHIHGGFSIQSYAGEGWSAWGNLRQVLQTNEPLARPGLLTRNEGGLWAHEDDISGDVSDFQYNEMRGGVAFSWEWGSVAFQKNHFMWGDNYNGANILSVDPTTPSYPMVSMQLTPGERFSFHYHHGWLNSMVIDSTRVIDFPDHPARYDYYNKFFATNIFTFSPVHRLHISAGNSIVYSANNVYIANFIPFMVFRALEPAEGESAGVLNNPAAFINISSRQIRHLHLYGTWFANSFKFERLGDDDRLNYTSTKAGARLTNWPIPNTSFTVEYTFTNPKTFDHRTPIVTYEHKLFNMGHYLGPNATDLYAAVDIKPWRGLHVHFSYNDARKGSIHPHVYGTGAQDMDPFMQEVVWRNTAYTLEARYRFFNNIGIYAAVRFMNVETFDDTYGEGGTAEDVLHRFSPAFHHGETTTIRFGLYINQ